MRINESGGLKIDSKTSNIVPAHTVELHIEELILHGFSQGDRYRIGEAIERELARLFIEQGLPQSLSENAAIADLDLGAFEIANSGRSHVATGNDSQVCASWHLAAQVRLRRIERPDRKMRRLR